MSQAAFNFAHLIRSPAPARRSAATSRMHRPAAKPAPTLMPDLANTLGFDHARYGVVPPSTCLWPGHPVREGWERGRRLIGCRARPATLAVKRWLSLRLMAWQQGQAFDDHAITPQVLRSLESATCCPISGQGLNENAQVVAVDPARGWIAGNLALLDAQLATRWTTVDWLGAKAALTRAEHEPASLCEGLPLLQWRRIVALKSLATPLSHEEAMRIPLHVLPPNRLRLVNPIQELQAMLTLQLAIPGWGQRARLIADLIPLTLRNEFNLFFNSLLAQALRHAQGVARAEMRAALAQAWDDKVVQRRWLRFAQQVNKTLAGVLVDRLAREPMPGLHVVRHPAFFFQGSDSEG